MANLLELAQKMGITATSNEVEKKNNNSIKRRPWLEEESETRPEERKHKKGELKKPEAPLKRLDRRLEKIENRTNNLLKKAEKQQVESLQIKNKSKHIGTHREQKRNHAVQTKKASIVEFYCLKGLPKLILTHIKTKASYDDGLQKWISIIDTEDLKIITKKTASHLSVQILRLEKQGWFEILKSNNAGVRVIKLNPETYSLNQ